MFVRRHQAPAALWGQVRNLLPASALLSHIRLTWHVPMTHETEVLREHALEWIPAGLVAFLIFAGVAFYSFA